MLDIPHSKTSGYNILFCNFYGKNCWFANYSATQRKLQKNLTIAFSFVLAPGETALIAEEMAARDALRKLFKFDTASKPLPFGRQIHESNFPTKPNPTLKQWKSQVNVV